MTKQTEAMKLALEALEYIEHNYMSLPAPATKAITALREALAEQPAQQEQDRQIDQLIQERDHRDKIIDKLCDAVLGPDRYEWSSQYFFEDAVREVEERIAALEKPAQQEPVAGGWCDGCNPDNCQGCGPAAKPKHEPIFWYRPVGEDGGYEGPIHNGAIENVRKLSGVWKPLYTTPPPVTESHKRKPLFKEFIKWAGAQGYDCAQTCNSDTGEWIVLNPMTADLWKAWQAAHGIKE